MRKRYFYIWILLMATSANFGHAQFKSISGQLINGRGTTDKLDHVRIIISLNSQLLGNIYTDSDGSFQFLPTTDVATNPITPDYFKLHDNYPNPFNPVTMISYALDRPAWVALDIFNIVGQKVKTITNSYQISGNYAIAWDGTDDLGNRCSKGTYFCRLTVDGHTEIKKMCLMDVPNNFIKQSAAPDAKHLSRKLTSDILELKITDRDIADTTVALEFNPIPEHVALGDIRVHVYPFLRTAADTLSLMSGESAADTLDVYFEKSIEISSPHIEIEWEFSADSLVMITYYKVNQSPIYLKFNEVGNSKSCYSQVHFILSPRLTLASSKIRRGYVGVAYNDTIDVINNYGEYQLDLLTSLSSDLTFEHGRIFGTPDHACEDHLFLQLVDERNIFVTDSTWLIIKESHNIFFNEYAVDILEQYSTDGTHPYSWVDTYTGVTMDLYYKGERIAKANPNGSKSCYCCGLTFEDFFRAIQQLNDDLGRTEDVNNMTFQDMKYFINLWFVQQMWGDGPGIAMEQFGIGDRIDDFKNVRKGDYLQFWRTTGSGHSVIFINWVESVSGDTMGIRYWSTQGGTNGINYNIEYLNGYGGTVDPDIMYFSRIRSPENFTSFNRSKFQNYQEIVDSNKPIVPKAFMKN